ncbi:MAG: response regulator [Campylobacterota bacterium]|nr:response regulator [Campylobacterota bacterium]
MNILIIDDEIYLAQKVLSRLLEEGHSCDTVMTSHDINENKKYDTILLSTNLSSTECDKIIKKYKDAIIILLVTYISDATVTNPIKAGADDYLVKPFMMDELIRKIHHYAQFKALKEQVAMNDSYFDFLFCDVDLPCDENQCKFPILIETNDQKYADKLLFSIARRVDLPIHFVSLSLQNYTDSFSQYTDHIIYLTQYHNLKKSAKDLLLKNLQNHNYIICSMDNENEFDGQKVQMKNDNQLVTSDNIMTINDYVKLMVLSFQSKYPDTELSKKLGISRKSLWEKRKKMGIEKTKSKSS